MQDTKKIKNLKRKVCITVRFSEEERDLIAQKMAYTDARNREDFMRQMVLNGYTVKVDSTEIREYIRLLGNIAGNVNQIARRINETRNIYESDVADLKALCGEAVELAKASLKAQQAQAEKIKVVLDGMKEGKRA